MITKPSAAVALVCVLSFVSSTALAESALIGGLRIGAAYRTRPNIDDDLLFRVGAGLDWLHAAGPTLALRLDTTNDIDTTLALGLGWSFRGLIDGGGLPLGIRAGGLVATNLDASHKVGGRAHLEWGLWANRATIDLDVDVRHTLSSIERRDDGGLEILIGVSLRVVPWTPWRL